MTDSSPTIIDEIAAVVRQATTQSLDLSFNELLDMHESGELNISPDYQRLFRWSEGQRSRFIESLLLEMPVPPIFVIEDGEGHYMLIDGLQRISSYLHFRGKLEAPHLDPPVAKGELLRFSDCDIVTSLNGKTFDQLPSARQIRLKRAFIRVEVVRKGADPRFKYHMFKRLNTGGELLSGQQLRNCTIRMLDSAFPDFILKMSLTQDFLDCTDSLTQEQRLSAFDQELVLRFFALKNRRERFKHDVSDFLTDYMQDISDAERPDTFDYPAEEATFLKTFAVLQRALSNYSFAFANQKRTNLNSSFSVYHYESVTIGLQGVLAKIDVSDANATQKLTDVLRAIKLDKAFVDLTTGGGKNSPGKLNQRIAFVETRLTDAFA